MFGMNYPVYNVVVTTMAMPAVRHEFFHQMSTRNVAAFIQSKRGKLGPGEVDIEVTR